MARRNTRAEDMATYDTRMKHTYDTLMTCLYHVSWGSKTLASVLTTSTKCDTPLL